MENIVHKERHGLSHTPIYHVWKTMRQRCFNPFHANYKHYGGRGITICNEWDSPTAFMRWAIANGYEPGLTIERVDNDKNYDPVNCVFVTQKINNSNRRYNPNSGIYFKEPNLFFTQLSRKGKTYYGGSSKLYSEILLKRDQLFFKLKNEM